MTTGKNIDKLLKIAGEALGPALPAEMPARIAQAGPLGAELWALLQKRNGFFAFESALHVFPAGSTGFRSIERWNAPDLWRDHYQGLDAGCLFFAEDLFGGQFAIKDELVYAFDPETGALEVLASSIDAWAEAVLSDSEVLTGQPLAHTWQEMNGPIVAGERLLPAIPFVLGGEFSPANLRAIEAVKGMRFRGDLAVQIRDLPDGAQIDLKVIE